jgi:hypothetical protein
MVRMLKVEAKEFVSTREVKNVNLHIFARFTEPCKSMHVIHIHEHKHLPTPWHVHTHSYTNI